MKLSTIQTKAIQSKAKQFGQGMTEYIIIVALIAIAAIGVYSMFGETVRDQVSGLANELSGQNADQDIQAAQTTAGDARTESQQDTNLGNYNERATYGE